MVDKDQVFGIRSDRREFQDTVQDLIGCQVAPPEDIRPELLMVPPASIHGLGRLLAFGLGEPTTRRGRANARGQGHKENAKPKENAAKGKDEVHLKEPKETPTREGLCCCSCHEPPPRRMRGPGCIGATDRVDVLIRNQTQAPTDLRKTGMQCLCCERLRYPAAKTKDSAGHRWRKLGVAPDGVSLEGGSTPMPPFRCLNSGPGVWARQPATHAKPSVVPAADRKQQQQQQQQQLLHEKQLPASPQLCACKAALSSTTLHATARLAHRAAVRTPHCMNAAKGPAETKAPVFRPPSRHCAKVEPKIAEPASKWSAYQGFGDKASPFRG